ncbi:unnamed protein product [Phytophthora fragariaefolia]|uniref:Unnamed protein product n=1 Tax=Phytophthora fragariaefolia TaxID=1490495 RepID=A0A9W7CW42_9STRA|nr:unnamed protein product [Phytophthora fragariaefolia]
MAVDDTNRQILTDLKAEEKEREERSLYESFRDLQMRKQEQKKKTTNQDSHIQRYETEIKHESPSPSEKSKKKVTFANIPHERMPERRHRNPAAAHNFLPATPDNEVIELTDDGSFDISNPAKPTVIDQHFDATTDDESQSGETSDWVEVSRDEAIELDGALDTPTNTIDIPPPRECIQSEIRFTPRVFPTPSRESKAAEEEDWLLKNRKHINKHQGLNRTSEYDISETDRTSQRNPFLKNNDVLLTCMLMPH